MPARPLARGLVTAVTMIVVAALLASCASVPNGLAEKGAAVYTPTRDIAGPSGGISKRCVPLANGIGADCRPL